MRYGLLLIILLSLMACTHEDHKKIVGKWYTEDYWFEFYDDNTYDGGRGPMVNQKKQDYVLEPGENKMIFYTDKESESYYLKYEFKAEDTLVLTNSMNQYAIPAVYYKKK